MAIMNGITLQSSWIVLSLLFLASDVFANNRVIWSVNSGGERHVDTHGIVYDADRLAVGTASDYGTALRIGRAHPADQILYQTERYHHEDFTYKIPVREEGDYVLVLKFCEVWFNAPRQKVFNVRLNDIHEIVEDLDIFGKVGRGVAHDEIIPFRVTKKHIFINGKKSPIVNNHISLTLVKGDLDNPKLNAAVVIKGSVNDVPKLPPLGTMPEPENLNEEEEEEEEEEEDVTKPPPPSADNVKRKHSSGPKIADPYTMSDSSSSYMIPIIVAIGAFIPLLYCLCKI